jgi:hypothetical protein
MKFIKENDFIIDSETGELYFDLKNLPKSIQLDQCTFISDCKKFVESHFAYITTYAKTDIKTPYLNRLIQLKNIL